MDEKLKVPGINHVVRRGVETLLTFPDGILDGI
jgi:hypothetical protein